MFKFPDGQFGSTQYDKNSGFKCETFLKAATSHPPPTWLTLGPIFFPVSAQYKQHHCPRATRTASSTCGTLWDTSRTPHCAEIPMSPVKVPVALAVSSEKASAALPSTMLKHNSLMDFSNLPEIKPFCFFPWTTAPQTKSENNSNTDLEIIKIF